MYYKLKGNRTIKERIRSTFHRSPFTTLPKLVLIFLVAECASNTWFVKILQSQNDFAKTNLGVQNTWYVQYRRLCTCTQRLNHQKQLKSKSF